MLMRITFQIAGVFLISKLGVERNVLLHSGYIAIFVMIKSKTRSVVIMMMFNQSRTSMNAPENKGDSYQHQGKSTEHHGAVAMDLLNHNGYLRV